MTQLNKVSEYPTYLHLRKQKFLCKDCGRSFLAESSLTKRNCSISNRVKLKIATMLHDSVSMTYIANQVSVAPMTVLRVLREFTQPVLPQRGQLPQVLCFDEFKSGKFADGAMSCILMDGAQTKIFDLIEDRKKKNLEKYFDRFSLKARNRVRYVVSDFYNPYISLAKAKFPKAQVIIDRFHLSQLISTTFKNHRIAVMNSFPKKCPSYKHLKRYWRLLQKTNAELDYEHRYWQPSFRDYLTQTEIVDRLLSYSEELRAGYEVYQSFLRVIRYSNNPTKQAELRQSFQDLLEQGVSSLPESYQTTLTTYRTYRKEILHSLSNPYSNGPVEATNNHIKVLKRVAYGFRNFTNFKTRIFLNRGQYFRIVPK